MDPVNRILHLMSDQQRNPAKAINSQRQLRNFKSITYQDKIEAIEDLFQEINDYLNQEPAQDTWPEKQEK